MLNEVFKCILTRRSIRKYSGQQVSDEVVKELLKAAMSAPSAHNQQPWHFVVIKDREVLNKVTRFHPYSSMLKEAALAILVCGDKNLFRAEIYWTQDCSAATQNILIAAHSLGLGAVWLGVYPKEVLVKSMATLVGAPENIIPFCLISIGYPGEEKPPADRFEEKRVHIDKW